MPFHILIYISFQISFQILQDKKYRNVLGVRSELLLSILYRLIFLSLIQKWVIHIYLQVRKFADRSLIYRLQISFYLNLRPFQDHFTHIETS